MQAFVFRGPAAILSSLSAVLSICNRDVGRLCLTKFNEERVAFADGLAWKARGRLTCAWGLGQRPLASYGP